MIATVAEPVTYGRDKSAFRFSVAKYLRMVQRGILDKYDKVELLENHLVMKMSRSPPHDATIQKLNRLLHEVVLDRWSIRTQAATTLSDSQPEPDFAIVRGSANVYDKRHPIVSEIGLLIEVAESSLERDQLDKLRIYSRAGIPNYWVVNLIDRRVEVHSHPSGPSESPAFGTDEFFSNGEQVPLVLDGVTVGTISVSDMLPAA